MSDTNQGEPAAQPIEGEPLRLTAAEWANAPPIGSATGPAENGFATAAAIHDRDPNAPLMTHDEYLALAEKPAAPTDEERAAAAEKYAPTKSKTLRDEVLAFFAPLRALITHAANGDRTALASVLTGLVDLHQGGPLQQDMASDHLRAAGAAVVTDRIDDAHVALAAAANLLPAGPILERVSAASDALAAADPEAALIHIDAAIPQAEETEPEPAPVKPLPNAKSD